jgi:hypothetical protein
MARFFDSYPQLRTKGAQVAKHGTLVCEIGKQIEGRREYACGDGYQRSKHPPSPLPPVGRPDGAV